MFGKIHNVQSWRETTEIAHILGCGIQISGIQVMQPGAKLKSNRGKIGDPILKLYVKR